MTEPLRFESPDAPTDDVPFCLVGKRPVRDESGRVVRQEPVEGWFMAKAAVSYGVLVDDLVAEGGGDNDATWDFFGTVLVVDNSDPDDRIPTEERDERGELLRDDAGEVLVRSELERFRAFVTDRELYFHPDTIIGVARKLAEQSAGRPTELPVASRRTRRSAGRGSGGRR